MREKVAERDWAEENISLEQFQPQINAGKVLSTAI